MVGRWPTAADLEIEGFEEHNSTPTSLEPASASIEPHRAGRCPEPLPLTVHLTRYKGVERPA